MESVFVKLVDRQGNVLWVSGYDHTHWERPLCDYADDEDRSRVEKLFADVIIRCEQVDFFARWSCPMVKLSGIWCWTRIHPMDSLGKIQAVSAVVMQKVLPGNFDEFTENDKRLLSLLAEDCAVKEIAQKLGRSESAIDLRIRTLKDKLGANTLHGLVASGLRGHLIKMPRLPESAA